jgi:pimeloyl-ACP methyl ester carboxylesterase
MTDFVMPETRYARSGEVNIAYQVIGEGPIDILVVPGAISHLELVYDLPGCISFLQRLSRFARIINFDKRGQGLSDRISGVPSLEERMDDVRAVLDAVGSRRTVLVGFSEGCAMSTLFCGDQSRARLAFGTDRRLHSLRPTRFRRGVRGVCRHDCQKLG